MKSTKTPCQEGFLVNFANNSFFVVGSFRENQLHSPKKLMGLKKETYEKRVLRGGKKPIPLTANEVVILGRLVKTKPTKQPGAKIVHFEKAGAVNNHHYDHKTLDRFVAKMMDPGACSSYIARQRGPATRFVRFEGLPGAPLTDIARAHAR